MAEYYNVTTNLGDAEIANAIATNTKLNITHVAFGDGNGSVPTPNKARTSLVREVHRQAVTKYERHATNANWIVIETIIPSGVGGFTIREMGIIANGKLISHGSHAPFEKVADPSGVSEYRLRFTQNVTDGSVVEIMLDESLIYASQAWVEENFIKRSEIVDNLTTNDATKPVSAKQAKVLQDNKLGKTENASSASKLQTVRTVSFSGAATGSFNYDGSSNSSAVLTLANSGVVAGTYGTTFKIPVITVNAKGLISTITTQDIPTASTEQKGIVQLNDTLTSTSTIQALTAAQGKKLQDEKVAKTDVVNNLTSTDTQKPLSAAQGNVLNDQAFGIDQQPINMTSTRFKNTTYTNTTKKAKVISIGGTDSRGGYAEFFVNSIPVSRLTKSSNVSTSMCAVVPPGSAYELGDFNFSFWTET